MSTVGERVFALRKELGSSPDVFAEKIGISEEELKAIEEGTGQLADSTFITLCKKEYVNPDWLENGTGSMFLFAKEKRLQEDVVISAAVAKILKEEDGYSFKRNLLLNIASFSDSEWQALKVVLNAFIYSEGREKN